MLPTVAHVDRRRSGAVRNGAARAGVLGLAALGLAAVPRPARAQTVRICATPYLEPTTTGASFAAAMRDFSAAFRANLAVRVAACETSRAELQLMHADGRVVVRTVTFERPELALAALSANLTAMALELALPAAPVVVVEEPEPPPPPATAAPSAAAPATTTAGDDPAKEPVDDASDGVATSLFAPAGELGESRRSPDRFAVSLDVGIRAYLAPTPTGAYAMRVRHQRRFLTTELLYLTNRVTGLAATDIVQLHQATLGLGVLHGFARPHLEVGFGALTEFGFQFLNAASGGTSRTGTSFVASFGARCSVELAFPLGAHRVRAGMELGATRGVQAQALDSFGRVHELGGFHGMFLGGYLGYGYGVRTVPR